MMRFKGFTYILSCLLVLASCGCTKPHVQPSDTPDTPSTPVTPDPPGFQRYITDLKFPSNTLREHVTYSIYLPADYDTDTETRYSVVYMLHGLGDNNNSWNGNYLHANSKINSWEARGLSKMIYVFPKGFSSYFCNFYNGSYNYMDMFINELIPEIDAKYRTIPDREHRAITGYSMGGFGACALAEKHPETFIACAPLSMSVRTDQQYMAESQSGWESQWGTIFGGIGERGEGRITDYYKQHCPIHYFNPEHKEQLSQVHWYLICGDDEKNLLYAIDELHCVMQDNGYQHEYRVVDGGHSASVWMPALDEVLPMFDHYMNGGQLWTRPVPGDTPYTVDTEADGAYQSAKYKESHTGTALYLVHKGLDDVDLRAVMAAADRPTSNIGYVILPCDISKKSLDTWMQEWDGKYPSNKKLVLGIGEGAGASLSLPASTFARSYFINPDVGDGKGFTKGQVIYFALTDEDLNYQGADVLYNLCKNADTTFEYRVIDASGTSWFDLYQSIQAIKSNLYY